MVVEGVCLLVVLIGRLCRHGAGLVGMLNEVPASVESKLGPPAVQCESQAPPDLLEENGLALPVADVEELEVPIGEMRGDQVNDDVEYAGQLRVSAGDEAQDPPRDIGVESDSTGPGEPGFGSSSASRDLAAAR